MKITAGQWRLPPNVLPEGDQRDLWIDGGCLTTVAVPNAESLPGRFALPGLVDAHAHVSITRTWRASALVAARNLRRARDQGTLLLRDLGAPRSLTLSLRPGPLDPTLLVAGRWLAPQDRFYAPLFEPVPSDSLIDVALGEVARGASWIKVVTDWRSPELSYPAEVLRHLVDAVHAAGARLAAHAQWELVREVVAAGFDSIEHGSKLDLELLDVMAARNIAWTPTLTAFNSPIPEDATPERRASIMDARDRFRTIVPAAAARGVRILAGTDTAGTLLEEVRWLIRYGLTPVDALRAASTSARTFLGFDSLDHGAPADVTTYEDDPRSDPDVLAHPAAIVLHGQRIA